MQQQQEREQRPPRQQINAGEIVLVVVNGTVGLLFMAVASLYKSHPPMMICLGILGSLLLASAVCIATRLRQVARGIQALLSLLAFLLLALYLYVFLTLPKGPRAVPDPIVFLFLGALMLLGAFFAWSSWLLKRSGEE